MEPTFQRKKPTSEEQPERRTQLPELANPVYRQRLINAYRRIEAEYQRRQQQKVSNIT